MAVMVAFFTTSFVSCLLRLYVRGFIVRALKLDDWFMALAMVRLPVNCNDNPRRLWTFIDLVIDDFHHVYRFHDLRYHTRHRTTPSQSGNSTDHWSYDGKVF
jgi:hypothetical protein